MRKYVRKVMFCIWTIVVIAGIIFFGNLITRDIVLSGTNISFNTGRDVQIDTTGKVTFQAASSDFFVLRKTSGDVITGVPAPKPLGWSGNQYFVAGPEEISGGLWLFPDGTASMVITSKSPITVRLIQEGAGGRYLHPLMQRNSR